jgi:cell wall-associated NlpC family hydrolase
VSGQKTGELTARLLGPRPRLDPRAHVFRGDFADVALAGELAAHHYVEPLPMRCTAARAPLRKAGDGTATAVSELLFGEDFDLFDVQSDWGFGRTAADRYTGWVAMAALGEPGPEPSQRISARVAPVFASADIKARVLMELPFGARVAGEAGEKFLALQGGGFVHRRHVAPMPSTPIEVARLFAGAPYLWGGRTPLGVDCSGLVQAALTATGTSCPRDSDQQLAALGTAMAFEDRAAGDIVFFPGHVGILASRDRLFHANAHWMSTVEEPLDDVIARLVAAGALTPVTGVKRLA